jgi:hypothetical protein
MRLAVTVSVSPFAVVMVGVLRELAARVRFPSSMIRPEAVCEEPRVTVKVPVALAAAEKTAVSPVVQAVVAVVPAAELLQKGLTPQMPVGVAPPAPATGPVASQ